MENLLSLWQSTGLYNFTGGQAFMMLVGFLLLFLAIKKGFEPLLLLPIGFGAVLSNIPVAGIAEEGGLLYYLYFGIKTGMFPLLIFMGVGAMTDFGPMLANPKTLLLGAAAQFGIFASLLGALALNVIPGLEFSLKDAAAIGIIGGADGPTAIYVSSKLAPDLLGAIAVRLTSPGPVLFWQDRYGRDGVTFRVVKLRTMVVDQGAVVDLAAVVIDAPPGRIIEVALCVRVSAPSNLSTR